MLNKDIDIPKSKGGMEHGDCLVSHMIIVSGSMAVMLMFVVHVVFHMQASRAVHAAELLGVLHSLWDATDIPSEERAHFVKLMSGPLRLHGRSLEKVDSLHPHTVLKTDQQAVA